VTKIKGRISPTPSAATVELINSTGDLVDQIRVPDEGAFVLHVSRGTWRLRAYDQEGRRGDVTVDVHNADVDVQVDLV
jgi:uncharacterized protein (DUF1684 family)